MSIIERISGIIPGEKKVDALMTFVHNSLSDFINAEEGKYGVLGLISEEDAKIINDEVNKIWEYLDAKVVHFDSMQFIVDSVKSGALPFGHYCRIEPNLFYYDKIATTALSKIKQIAETANPASKKEEQKWVPDYLAFCLIHDAIDTGLSFKKYEMLETYDFSKIFSIYRKANSLLKKAQNIEGFEHNTMTRRMENLSITMIERLNKSTFKLRRNQPKKKR